MGGTEEIASNGLKRKRSVLSQAQPLPADRPTLDVDELETSIKSSQKNYNNIVTLLQLARDERQHKYASASLALCRVFCRLLVEGKLSRSRKVETKEALVSEWLRKKYEEYKEIILSRLNGAHPLSEASWDLTFQLLRVEVASAEEAYTNIWKHGLFANILDSLCDDSVSLSDCKNFAMSHMRQYDDVRHYTFGWIIQTLRKRQDEHLLERILTMLSEVKKPSKQSATLPDLLCDTASAPKVKAISFSLHKKKAEQAWLALLRSDLKKEQRKRILNIMTNTVIPWFQDVTMLMDFLTDSYNIGGATSLLALSGLFHLMQEKNLDYPDFYTKLYSLLDHNVLHSKHRSRFFRLLDTFLSSSHLPAALVASFIKRLSRLALHAPPAGIVALMPWIYNMLKSHPTCTFMIHRVPRTEEERRDIGEKGVFDPFDMTTEDPMHTNAIDGCLWEIETLRSHYHPNVGSLAGIIAEQFTKRSYELEDFLDHSYNSFIESELGKDLKKTPVVEFDIPKTIFTRADGDSHLESLMTDIMEYDA